MITTDQASQLVNGRGRVIDADGNKIGDIGQVFLGDQSDQPEWVTAKTGLFGGGESFVPLQRAEVVGDDVRVAFDKDTVKNAPRISDSEGHLSEQEEDTLFEHYGLTETTGTTTGTDTDQSVTGGALSGHDATDPYDDTRNGPTDGVATTDHVGGLEGDLTTGHDADRHADHGTGTDAAVGRDTSGPETDSAMTRSEEQLHVGTQTRETGRARLRKHIVTEQVSTNVPVSHEEVRVEREPITDANMDDALSGGQLTEEEHEVVLHEERPVVDKQTVPVERVRLDKDTVAGQEQVDEEVRKEQIDVLDDDTSVTGNGTTGTTGTTGRDDRG